jgi:hypothetical protein
MFRLSLGLVMDLMALDMGGSPGGIRWFRRYYTHD